MEKKSLIILHPISESVEGLINTLSADEGLEIQEVNDPKEAQQLLEFAAPAMIITSDTTKCVTILANCKVLIKHTRSKIILTGTKPLPPKAAKKLDQLGLASFILEPITTKSLNYKINFLIKSLPFKSILATEEEAEKKQVITIKTTESALKEEEQKNEDLYGVKKIKSNDLGLSDELKNNEPIASIQPTKNSNEFDGNSENYQVQAKKSINLDIISDEPNIEKKDNDIKFFDSVDESVSAISGKPEINLQFEEESSAKIGSSNGINLNLEHDSLDTLNSSNVNLNLIQDDTNYQVKSKNSELDLNIFNDTSETAKQGLNLNIEEDGYSNKKSKNVNLDIASDEEYSKNRNTVELELEAGDELSNKRNVSELNLDFSGEEASNKVTSLDLEQDLGEYKKKRLENLEMDLDSNKLKKLESQLDIEQDEYGNKNKNSQLELEMVPDESSTSSDNELLLDYGDEDYQKRKKSELDLTNEEGEDANNNTDNEETLDYSKKKSAQETLEMSFEEDDYNKKQEEILDLNLEEDQVVKGKAEDIDLNLDTKEEYDSNVEAFDFEKEKIENAETQPIELNLITDPNDDLNKKNIDLNLDVSDSNVNSENKVDLQLLKDETDNNLDERNVLDKIAKEDSDLQQNIKDIKLELIEDENSDKKKKRDDETAQREKKEKIDKFKFFKDDEGIIKQDDNTIDLSRKKKISNDIYSVDNLLNKNFQNNNISYLNDDKKPAMMEFLTNEKVFNPKYVDNKLQQDSITANNKNFFKSLDPNQPVIKTHPNNPELLELLKNEPQIDSIDELKPSEIVSEEDKFYLIPEEVFYPASKGIEFSIILLNKLLNKNFDLIKTLQAISQIIFKTKHGVTSFFYTDINFNNVNDILVNHTDQQYAPHNMDINTWNKFKAFNIQRWQNAKFPKVLNEKYNKNINEFCYPIYDENKKLGFVVITFFKDCNSEDMIFCERLIGSIKQSIISHVKKLENPINILKSSKT